jgi:hypothetical protein
MTGEVAETKPPSRIDWLAWTLAVLLILIGGAVRARIFQANGSLYRDESALALNIVHRSPTGLFKPLDNEQGAPVGFLMLEKLAVTIGGNNERALRAVPLVASILALPLFYMFCRRIMGSRLALIPLAVLALGTKQYEYAVDAKQYSMDVCLTSLLLLMAISDVGVTWLAAAGAVAIWFSHPIIFVLAGVGAALLMRGKFKQSLIVAAAWGASFAANYLLILKRLSHSDYMQQFWAQAGAFAPIPKSIGALIWYKKTFFVIFENPLSLGFAGLAALVFLLGIAALFRRQKPALVMLLLPALLALAASVVHKYPFSERLILFIAPLLAACIGAGFEYLWEGARRPVGIVALILLAISPLNTMADYLRSPPQRGDIRASMQFVAAHRLPDDVYYVYPFCENGFNYYKERLGMASAKAFVGLQGASWDAYRAQLSGFSGKRIWVLFEEPSSHDGIDDQQMALVILDSLGKRIWEDKPFGEYVACYDLTAPPLPSGSTTRP